MCTYFHIAHAVKSSSVVIAESLCCFPNLLSFLLKILNDLHEHHKFLALLQFFGGVFTRVFIFKNAAEMRFVCLSFNGKLVERT